MIDDQEKTETRVVQIRRGPYVNHRSPGRANSCVWIKKVGPHLYKSCPERKRKHGDRLANRKRNRVVETFRSLRDLFRATFSSTSLAGTLEAKAAAIADRGQRSLKFSEYDECPRDGGDGFNPCLARDGVRSMNHSGHCVSCGIHLSGLISGVGERMTEKDPLIAWNTYRGMIHRLKDLYSGEDRDPEAEETQKIEDEKRESERDKNDGSEKASSTEDGDHSRQSVGGATER